MKPDRSQAVTEVDALVVGAGFAGMYMLIRLRELGLSTLVIEAGNDVGGTWYWNRYPGARCDVQCLDYSYSFSKELEQEWDWTERFATQPEILRYATHVADRFDLRRDILFGAQVTAAVFDEERMRWLISTDRDHKFSARFCIMATGCLSVMKGPEFEGLDRFSGPILHTGNWPHTGVDFTGQRVAVIGTGSSGIQAIPVIAEMAGHLTVFQRTPSFSMPAHHAVLDPAVVAQWKANYEEHRRQARLSGFGAVSAPAGPSALAVTPEERTRTYEDRWGWGSLSGLLGSYSDVLVSEESNQTTADFVREKIRQTVHDPEIAEALLPWEYPIGTKRPCLDDFYFETFNRDNVSLVDLRRTPITEITTSEIRTTKGEYPVECIVLATGFDAMTGALSRIEITGRNGRALRDKWAGGPRTYLGLATAGFPNLFTITGPQSPSVLTNMIVSIEQHVDWITDCLAHLRHTGAEVIEATVGAEDAWVEHVREIAELTLYPKANSWYMGANVPGKPRVMLAYVGGADAYRKRCDQVALAGYDGFSVV